MDPPSYAPSPEALRDAFTALDSAGFRTTSRLPIFAARHWSPARELDAFRRFHQGGCNIEEVAVPRWYWSRLPASLDALFRALTLALPTPPPSAPLPDLAPLWRQGGLPGWRVIHRFGRYVLHSRPEVQDDSLVYFGDDTLFLMEQARRLLGDLEGPVRVLDLCCGGGGVGLGLPPFRGEMVGVDIHPAAIALATLTARAQNLDNYSYVCDEAESALEGKFDLVVGNPPTLSPDLGGRPTLHATGAASRFTSLLERLTRALTPRGRALLTVFSQAEGQGETSSDALRGTMRELLGPKRGFRYSVRRQFPLGEGRWLRHVALEILPHDSAPGERFEAPAEAGIQLPALDWRRRF